MNDLLRAIADDLDADGPRLVYADVLQAAGDPRGELITVQCELARLGCDRMRVGLWPAPGEVQTSYTEERRSDWIGDALATFDRSRVHALRLRDRELLGRHEGRWAEGLPPGYRFGRGFVDHLAVGYDADLESAFDRAPFTRSLELEKDHDGSLFTTPRLAQLRQLRVRLTNPNQTRRLLTNLPRMIYLRELAVRTTQQAPTTLDGLYESPALPQLSAIDLYGQPIEPPQFERLLETCVLRDLRLGKNGDGGWLATLLARSSRSRTLEILDLYRLEMLDAAAPLFRSPHLRNLRALRVSERGHAWLQGGGALAIGESLHELVVLDLGGNPVGPHLAQLAGPKQLVQLALPRCQLGDADIEVLAASPLLASLRVLDLRHNPFGDAGLRALAAAKLGALEVIDLRGVTAKLEAYNELRGRFDGLRVRVGDYA